VEWDDGEAISSVQQRALTLFIDNALAKDEADSMVEKRCGFAVMVVIVMGFC
jgi:hypothetical protein